MFTRAQVPSIIFAFALLPAWALISPRIALFTRITFLFMDKLDGRGLNPTRFMRLWNCGPIQPTLAVPLFFCDHGR